MSSELRDAKGLQFRMPALTPRYTSLLSRFGALSIESGCAWGTIKSYTAKELGNQVHCYEDGSNCVKQ